MTPELPESPFELFTHAPFQAAGRRELEVFGSAVELLWLPQRKARRGVPTTTRPPFLPNIAEKIIAEEAVWRGGGAALTANRFPFAKEQIVLWAEDDIREPTCEMLEIAFELEARSGGTTLINSTGAAASIARAHMHIVSDRLPFLTSLSTEPHKAPYIQHLQDVEVHQVSAPIPVVVLAVKGNPVARAKAVHRLLQLRTTPAFNLVSSADTTWILPRSIVEIPKPHFPHALGAAELWGRWCFGDQEPFEKASPEDLERAILSSGIERS